MRYLKKIFFIVLAFLLVLTIAVIGLVSALNTKAGQNYAVHQINHFGKASIHLEGFSGNFPNNMQIQSLQLIDADGAWFNAQNIKLEWSPLVLLRRHLSIQTLKAQEIDVLRIPVSQTKKSKKSNGYGFSFPHFSITLNKLEIDSLNLGAPLAGRALTLHVTGHASLLNFYNADIALNAISNPNSGSYQLTGTLTPKTVSLNLSIHEQSAGLIGHIIDSTANNPLDISTNLIGPRNKAQLTSSAQFGLAKIKISGLLGVSQVSPYAKIDVSTPSLASFSALDGLNINGSAALNFMAAQPLQSNKLNFSINGLATLTKTSPKFEKLLLGQTTLNIDGFIKNYRLNLKTLNINSPGFSFSSSGIISKKNVNLKSFAHLKNISDLFPNLNGQVDLKTKLTGPVNNLQAKANLSGQMFPSGNLPEQFLITLNAWNLQNSPYGTLHGNGSFAGSPLSLSAKFFYNQKSTSHFELKKLAWKSLAAQADLKLKAGDKLPTGFADLKFNHLSDLDFLLPKKLSGAMNADFSFQKNHTLTLSAIVQNANLGSDISNLNGNLNVLGKLDAMAIKFDAHSSKFLGQPANAAFLGELNLLTRTLNINSLNGEWSGLHTELLSPALFEMKPDFSIDHLNLKVANSNIVFNGTLSPILNANASIKNFDLSLLQKFSPNLSASGLLNINANLTGLSSAPEGKITIKATSLRYLSPMTSSFPAANLTGGINLEGQSAEIKVNLNAVDQANITLSGDSPLSMAGPVNLNLKSNISASLLNKSLSPQNMNLDGKILLDAHISGTPRNPSGFINLKALNIHNKNGIAAAMPTANLTARADIKDNSARLDITLNVGPDASLVTRGTIPLVMTQAINLQTTGQLDLKLLNPIFAADGSLLKGTLNTQISAAGPLNAPQLKGSIELSNASLLNVQSGLNLTSINAVIKAENQLFTLQNFSADAGRGKITGYGKINLADPALPVDLNLNADQATPISSDLLTETLNAAITLKGGLRTGALLAGKINILKANINIPHSLPPSIANLPIHYEGDMPSISKGNSSSILPFALALELKADNKIFIRGDGLFAELGGHVTISGMSSYPIPTGDFSLIRGSFSLAGKTLQFTQGNASFNGDGFIPALYLEATTPTSNSGTATLTISGTASKPKISLSSSPPLPSDEILSQLLFAQNADNLSPFQAASLAAALAQISGVGGGFSPLESTRHALGLDELSVDSSDKGGPSVQAGRYVAPGVYVGASQSATGQGSKANIEINLYKGLKLQSSTGTDSTGQSSSSVGLGYQFNY